MATTTVTLIQPADYVADELDDQTVVYDISTAYHVCVQCILACLQAVVASQTKSCSALAL